MWIWCVGRNLNAGGWGGDIEYDFIRKSAVVSGDGRDKVMKFN